MTRLQSLIGLSERTVTAVMLGAHLLAAFALVAFGWRAGGFALHGPAAYGYLLLTGLAALVFGVTLRRNDAWAEVGRIVLAPWLALLVAGVWYATAVFGATYAPYGLWDNTIVYALSNAAYATLGCGLALGLRWPRLLIAWALAHGLALAVGLGVFGQLHYVSLINPFEFWPWLFVPLAYALAGLALGWRPTRRTRRPSRWLVLAWSALALASVLGLSAQFLQFASLSPDFWISLAVSVPGLLWFTVLILPLGWHAWRARSEWNPERLAQAPAASAWIAFAGALLFGVLLAGYLLSPERLPRPGEVQGWISSTHIVPIDAWLPALGWSAWLFVAARWLLVPIAILGLAPLAQVRSWPALSVTTGLLGAGVAALVTWGLDSLTPIRLIPNTVMSGMPSPWLDWGPLSIAPLLLALGLFFSGRLWQHPLGLRLRAGLVLFISGLLAFFLAQQAAGAWPFARFLFWPRAAWAAVGDYAPAPPVLLAGLGLGLHLLMFAVGLIVVGVWLRGIQSEWPLADTFWPTVRRLAGVSGAAFMALAIAWYGLTMPRPLRVVPPPGARDVPLDTLVLIEFPAPSTLDTLLAGGFMAGLETRYADTGEYIPGTTGSGANGLTFDPEGLLRPGALVEIIGHWGSKRPYVLRFTTAGTLEPSATPLPFPTNWPSPAPTVAAPN